MPIIGTTDDRNVAFHRLLQDLLGARTDHPLEVVAVNPVEREWHVSDASWVFGGQVGYNFQLAPLWVVGVEGDASGSGLRGS